MGLTTGNFWRVFLPPPGQTMDGWSKQKFPSKQRHSAVVVMMRMKKMMIGIYCFVTDWKDVVVVKNKKSDRLDSVTFSTRLITNPRCDSEIIFLSGEKNFERRLIKKIDPKAWLKRWVCIWIWKSFQGGPPLFLVFYSVTHCLWIRFRQSSLYSIPCSQLQKSTHSPIIGWWCSLMCILCIVSSIAPRTYIFVKRLFGFFLSLECTNWIGKNWKSVFTLRRLRIPNNAWLTGPGNYKSQYTADEDQ